MCGLDWAGEPLTVRPVGYWAKRRYHWPMARKEKILVLDGPMGTELSRLGHDTALPLWSARPLLRHPSIVTEVHVAYLRAGADIVTTNTFRTNPRAFRQAGLGVERAREATKLAVECAKGARSQAGRPGVLVAGGVAPAEDCYHPERVPSQAELENEHGLLAQWLAELGVDVILVETMSTVMEAHVAVSAAAATGLPVWASFICAGEGTVLSGEPLASAVSAVVAAGATAVGVNCVPVELASSLITNVATMVACPVIVYPNGGIATNGGWAPDHDLTAPRFAALANQWIEGGATILGGCCGTNTAHIAALRRVVDNRGTPA